LDPSVLFSEQATPIWAVLSSLVGGIGAWLLGRRNIDAAVERVRIETNAEMSATETEERTAFHAMLMAEVTVMRQLMKECEADQETLRERLNTAMAQSLILRATVEIMEERVAFFKEPHTPNDEVAPDEKLGGDTTQA
jgi:IS1 family transposase